MFHLTFCKAATENVNLKVSLFESLAATLRPDAILATNTSSISITKMAAAAIPKGETAASEKGKASAARVVGEKMIITHKIYSDSCYPGLHFFNPVPVMVRLY